MTTYGESAWRFWHYPIWNDTGIPGQSFGPGITYNNKDVCGWGALVARTSTDPDGKMTSDGLSGKQIAYDALDLPRKVTSGSTTSANYSYLADGTRTGAIAPISAIGSTVKTAVQVTSVITDAAVDYDMKDGL